MQIRQIPVAAIVPDPDQPRQTFDKTELEELTRSIEQSGLLQPIQVRHYEDGYMVVIGERRWRAHVELGRDTIDAVVTDRDMLDLRIAQLVENNARSQVDIVEEAQAYQRLIDVHGLEPAEIATRVGKRVHRIYERLELLRIDPQYLPLVRRGVIKPSAAWEMTKMSRPQQDRFAALVQAGRANTLSDIKACASAVTAPLQASLLDHPAAGVPKPMSAEDHNRVVDFERRVDQVTGMLNAAYRKGELDVVRRVNPGNARKVADQLELISKECLRIRQALITGAVQLELSKGVANDG